MLILKFKEIFDLNIKYLNLYKIIKIVFLSLIISFMLFVINASSFDITGLNINKSYDQGDINCDNKIDLFDLITVLKICSGYNDEFLLNGFDIGNNNKIQQEELIYLFLTISGQQKDNYEVKKGDYSDGFYYDLINNNYCFMKIINKNGEIIFKAHPFDSNIFGNLLHFQPFLTGAKLKNASIITPTVINNSSINVFALGGVSEGDDSVFGTWSLIMDFKYYLNDNTIIATCRYDINLKDSLENASQNLNLFLLSGNFLYNVPLINPIPVTGNSGTLRYFEFENLSNSNFISWYPDQQSELLLNNTADHLFIKLFGQYFNVDTLKMGYDPLKPQYFPDMNIKITQEQNNCNLELSCKYLVEDNKNFEKQNIFVSPFIKNESSIKNLRFNIELISKLGY